METKLIKTIEDWRSIPEYPQFFANSKGQIANFMTGRILTPKTVAHGHQQVTLCYNGKYDHQLVHKLVALTFLGPRPKDHDIRHLNKDRKDCSALNLEYIPHSLNRKPRTLPYHACPICNKMVSSSRHPRTCSPTCHEKLFFTSVVCGTCGKTIRKRRSLVNRTLAHENGYKGYFYCNRTCFSKRPDHHWKKGGNKSDVMS